MLAANPNSNLLDRMRCPSCGGFGPFHITARVVVEVHDEFTEDLNGDYEWVGTDPCRCPRCGHAGTIDMFTDPKRS